MQEGVETAYLDPAPTAYTLQAFKWLTNENAERLSSLGFPLPLRENEPVHKTLADFIPRGDKSLVIVGKESLTGLEVFAIGIDTELREPKTIELGNTLESGEVSRAEVCKKAETTAKTNCFISDGIRARRFRAKWKHSSRFRGCTKTQKTAEFVRDDFGPRGKTLQPKTQKHCGIRVRRFRAKWKD